MSKLQIDIAKNYEQITRKYYEKYKRNLTQKEIAKICKLQPFDITRIKQGKKPLDEYTIKALAKAFRVSPIEIIFGVTPENICIQNKTGLGEKAINYISQCDQERIDMLKTILETPEISNALLDILNAFAIKSIRPHRIEAASYTQSDYMDSNLTCAFTNLKEVLLSIYDKYEEVRENKQKAAIDLIFKKMNISKRKNKIYNETNRNNKIAELRQEIEDGKREMEEDNKALLN